MSGPNFQAHYSVGDLLWIPHEKDAYVSGRVEAVAPTRLEVKLEGQLSNIVFTVKPKESIPVFEPCGGHLRENVENLVDLDELSEAAVLYHVRKRFQKKLIYTSVGSILVAVNPFERLPIYEKADMDRARRAAAMAQPFPHVFVTAATAYKQLVENSKNQAVLISGESGAGKTETTKKVLAFLASVAPAGSPSNGQQQSPSSQHVSIENKILQSNPLLEALGNAKTLRNSKKP